MSLQSVLRNGSPPYKVLLGECTSYEPCDVLIDPRDRGKRFKKFFVCTWPEFGKAKRGLVRCGVVFHAFFKGRADASVMPALRCATYRPVVVSVNDAILRGGAAETGPARRRTPTTGGALADTSPRNSLPLRTWRESIEIGR